MREAGIEPIALLAKLARIGTSLPVEPVTGPAPLIDGFHFATFGRAPARFDMDELQALNARILHQLDFAAVAERLPAGMTEVAWETIRPNLTTLAGAADWWHVVDGPVTPTAEPEDREFLQEAARAAGSLDWGDDPWHALTGLLKAGAGRSGKRLFLPLRRAITGRDSGPEMAPLLKLIGKSRVIERLSQAAEATS
jgi:glutamyl-tRNA synthetase